MRAFLWRELRLNAASGAFAAAAACHGIVLALFVILWGGGMPALAGETVYDQLRVVQALLLCMLLPWAAVRCGAAERGNDLVVLAAATATSPSRLLAGQCAGRCVALAAIALAGLPPAIVAQQASAIPLMQVAIDLGPLLALCGVVAVITASIPLVLRSRLAEWVVASSAASALLWATASPQRAVPVLAIVLVAAAALMIGADSRYRYLSDEVARS